MAKGKYQKYSKYKKDKKFASQKEKEVLDDVIL